MRYIILDPEEGIFLGTKSDPERRGVGMLFSAHNLFEMRKAASWDNREDAESYMYTHIKRWCPQAFVGRIESDDHYVDVIDIVKSGFGDFAVDLIHTLPMPSDEIH